MDTSQLALVTYCGVAAAVGAVTLAARDLFSSRQEKTPSLRDLVRRIPADPADSDQGLIARFDLWFERTLYLSGVELSMTSALLLWLLLSLGLGSVIFVWSDDPLAASAGVILGGAGLFGYLNWAKAKRLKAIQEQFPGALDILARAVRAGESLEQAIELTADATKAPVSTEFRRTAKQLELGLSVSAAMRAFSRRIGLLDIRIFANSMTLHRETGGSLPTVLERLAAVIRDRMEYHRQLRSITSSGRFSVVVISALGPILFAYLFLVQPEYGKGLWGDPIGRWAILLAVISQLIGIAWVSHLVKSDY
ncbi:type II secretion system F family protein [Lignipirellula cremea]|uniref:Bacterial type II secretion system protein F domain protein n=1 Tax=Lignipirellula cremea TaxID=2528010 RepID=A0A518E531_9BACT|nr:type II secretion system F family protein [Lignipirellula cremea]QDU99205.1 Bacterial type II secretion system protein F domain protein [Lignipirellula cremea]